jgi:hypothetical protein
MSLEKLRPEMTAQQFADALAERHEDFYRRLPMGEIVQMLIFEKPDGTYEMVLCPWADAAERRFILASLRAMMKAFNVVRYGFFAEVWVSEATADEVLSPRVAPRDNPNRKERVFTVVCDRRLPAPVAVAQEIIRGRSGGVRKLLRVPNDGTHIFGGALTNLFGDEATMQ